MEAPTDKDNPPVATVAEDEENIAVVMPSDETEETLGESLLPVPARLPTAAATPLLQVVAPATLPEGYVFDAVMDGNRSIQVTVPTGGVEEGQNFSIPYHSADLAQAASPDIPVGRWRDGICDCFRHGICHPHWWTAYCCPLIVIAQILRRMQFTWWAGSQQATETQGKRVSRILFALVAIFYVIHLFLYFTGIYEMVQVMIDATDEDFDDYDALMEKLEEMDDCLQADRILVSTFGIVTFVWLWRLRTAIRKRYSIPGDCCADCCCTFWCACCSGAQMLRHTADYESQPAMCCSETGVPKPKAIEAMSTENVPLMV